MLFDSHMHCEYSCDSTMTLVQAVAAARQAKVGMIVTEHWDRDYPTNPSAFEFDLEDYFRKFTPYRSASVLLGIEVGMQEHTAQADEAMLAAYPFDCVIASLHCMNKRDLYQKSCYQGQTKAAAVAEYLEASLANLRLYHNFDTYGHLDYISRYMPYEDTELYYEEFPQLWDEVFTLLSKEHKALEINTRRLDLPQAVKALTVLYRRFAQLGGRYVTLGSDAHYTEHIARRLDVARHLAATNNLIPVYFKQRQMIKMED
ncbi:MAG: histidinol-phosphatase HisJ family protein [Acidaminococcaceae bacterium]